MLKLLRGRQFIKQMAVKTSRKTYRRRKIKAMHFSTNKRDRAALN